MGDNFNIDNIEKFHTDFLSMEISDISKIIKKMIDIKNNIDREKKKRKRAYDINDKNLLNKFTENLNEKIKKYHVDTYDLVDESLDCIEEFEASIRSDLYDYYWDVYIDLLIDLDIDFKDKNSIKENSDKIYSKVIEKVYNQIFDGKRSEIETNKRITYLNSITAYVFYKCKFLVPIED